MKYGLRKTDKYSAWLFVIMALCAISSSVATIYELRRMYQLVDDFTDFLDAQQQMKTWHLKSN